jgi:hypothetical protein
LEAAVPCMHIHNYCQAFLGLLTSAVVGPVQVPSTLAHWHLQIRESVIWTPSSPADTDGEIEAPCSPQSETSTQAQLLHAACSCECAVLASLCLPAAACHRAGPQSTSHPHADTIASLSHPAQCLSHSCCWPVGLHACTPDPHHLHFSTCTTARFRSQADADANAPVDLFNVWMFNITNVDEVRAGGLPKLVSATA